MTSGGYGAGGYGGSPYGGSSLATSTAFDIFCFTDVSMYTILADLNVTAYGDGGHFHPNNVTLDMDVLSGAGEPIDNAAIVVTASIPDTFTAEWIVLFTQLPADFTDLTNSHVYLGTTDAAGALVGLLFSKVGVAYTGSISFPSGNMHLDCTMQVLPGSAHYVTEGEYYVVRVAADYTLGVVYFYMTLLTDIAISGHKLRAVLPTIPYSSAANSPTDMSLVSTRGTLVNPVKFSLSSWCVGSSLIIPNLIPVADAGADQAVRSCSIIMLDGTGSYDPEGAPLAYAWRLIDAPSTSAIVVEENDGVTYPEAPPTGYTDKFYSTALALVDYADPLAYGPDGDVLVVDGEAHTIVGVGNDGHGFFVQLGTDALLDSYASAAFKILRQRGLKDFDTVHPTFFPDKSGFYRFDLTVNDGALFSAVSGVVVNSLESMLPRGCTPDLAFVFGYLSDYWNLLDDKERIHTFWSGLAQVASTELYTLWQHEYGKSLRDIQRYFNRRWLHYDLLLPEPLPELTHVRMMYGGVTSTFLDDAGIAAYGKKLVVHLDAEDVDVTVTITSADPVTPTVLAIELEQQLQGHARSDFSTYVIEDRVTGHQAIRIGSTGPFSVLTGTTLPFTVGDTNDHPSGIAGAGIGYKTYKTDQSLAGLGIVEDDFLSIDGVAYRIVCLVDDATDTYSYQRVLLKEELPAGVLSDWAIGSWVSSELLDFYNGLVSRDDYVDLEVFQSTDTEKSLVECRVLGISSALVSRMAVSAYAVAPYTADHTVYLAKVIRRTYVPIDALVSDVPTLQCFIVITNDEETLRRNVDYYLETVRGTTAIRFEAGMRGAVDVWEGIRPPSRLWAEYTYLDNRPAIEGNFGIAAGFTLDNLDELPSNIDYLSAVRGLWYSFYNGPTLANIRIGAQILLGLPFAEEDGVIEELRTDFSSKYGRMLVRDKANTQIVRSYSFPNLLLPEINPTTGVRYAEGDSVTQFAPLVEGVEVLDYVKDPLWFQGYLNQGIFYEVEKYHRFAVKVDMAAFNLSTLMFVRNFVLQIRPQYTYPMFVVEHNVTDTEISTTDQKLLGVTLNLHDSPNRSLMGSTFMLDEPRAAFGGWRNQLDSNANASDAAPVFPVPDTSIVWGLDKNFLLVPEEELLVVTFATFVAPFTPTLDSVFMLDQPVGTAVRFEDVAPAVVPALGYTLTAITSDVAPFNGTISGVRFSMVGTPGVDATDYKMDVLVAGVSVFDQAFVDATNTEVVAVPSEAVALGAVVGLSVSPATGGARSPVWATLRGYVHITGAMWTIDDTLDAGMYCAEHLS